VGGRILVDLLGYTGARGGTETYARELLPRVAARMPRVEWVGLVNTAGGDRVSSFFPGAIRTVPWVGAGRASWAAGEILAVDRAARRAGADLVWSPANFGPIRRGVPRVATVHDVIYHQVRGGLGDRASRAVTSWLMTRSARTADLLLTVSHAAKSSIVEQLGVPAERIHVVHNGSSAPRPIDDPWSALAGVMGAPDRQVILSTGNRMPHKNFDGLLQAIARIPSHARPLTVIPGSHGDDPLRGRVEALGLGGDILLAGWVTDDQLDALYDVADLYVCPSLVEGFGLPVVDALRRGCRVLANDVPVLREVGGDAARYADATAPETFARAIVSTLAEPDASADREARRQWASRFTWDAAADATAAALSAALQGGGRA
jgi:glycosyltransferase involved in cell wall biosynthesis